MNRRQKDNLKELRVTLQIMALPVTGQLKYGADRDGVISSLIKAFQHWHRVALLRQGSRLTARQKSALGELGSMVARLDASRARPSWSDEALRRSRLWRQLRRSARSVLEEFDWSLELPSEETLSGSFQYEATGLNPSSLELDPALPEACLAAVLAASG